MFSRISKCHPLCYGCLHVETNMHANEDTSTCRHLLSASSNNDSKAQLKTEFQKEHNKDVYMLTQHLSRKAPLFLPLLAHSYFCQTLPINFFHSQKRIPSSLFCQLLPPLRCCSHAPFLPLPLIFPAKTNKITTSTPFVTSTRIYIYKTCTKLVVRDILCILYYISFVRGHPLMMMMMMMQ